MKLEKGDKVTFTTDKWELKYEVRDNFLHKARGVNDQIFWELELDKLEFCKKAYGYKARRGNWPYSTMDDYEALTRCVIALAKEVHKRGGKTTVNGKDLPTFQADVSFYLMKSGWNYQEYWGWADTKSTSDTTPTVDTTLPTPTASATCTFPMADTDFTSGTSTLKIKKKNEKGEGMKLKHGDDVVFTTDEWRMEYEVWGSYLYKAKDFNERIFKKLDLDKHKFCRKAYGYEDRDGDWPESKVEDYEALTRCVIALAKEVYEEGGKTTVNGKELVVIPVKWPAPTTATSDIVFIRPPPLKIKKEKAMLKSIPKRLKRMLNANYRAFYKLGWVDKDLDPTAEGLRAKNHFEFDKFEKELGEVAKKRVKELKKELKKKE